VLNRPLEDEVEYYEEVPPARGKRLLTVAAFFAAIAGAGYLLLAQRHRADDNATARSLHEDGQASPVATPRAAPAGTAATPGKLEPEGDPSPPPAAARR
jgi:hypothetical protein